MAVLIAGALLARPAISQAPQTDSSVINPPYGPTQPAQPNNDIRPVSRPSNESNNRTGNAPPDRAYSGRHYNKEEVIQLIKDYSTQYGINPDVPLCIARLESGYNQLARNKSSSASGVFQYLNSTWAGTDESKAGLSVFDASANVRAAIKYMSSRKNTIPWVVNKKCPSL